MFCMQNLIWLDLHKQTAQASMLNQMKYSYYMNKLNPYIFFMTLKNMWLERVYRKEEIRSFMVMIIGYKTDTGIY